MNNLATENNLAESTAARIQEKSRALLEETKRAAAVTDEYVHDNPWTSIGVAAAIGLLVGFLLGQRKH